MSANLGIKVITNGFRFRVGVLLSSWLILTIAAVGDRPLFAGALSDFDRFGSSVSALADLDGDGDGDGIADSWESPNGFGPPARGRSTSVGIYCNRSNHAQDFVNRVASLGYTTTHWTSPGQVNPSSLAGIDVLFVHVMEADELAAQDAVIGAWVFEGNGLIVEQPNLEGDVAILPPGLDLHIWSHSYDGSHTDPDPVRNVQITVLGASHPIMSRLTTGDICENADRVWTWDVSFAYDILGVQVTNTDYVAVAVAAYGGGRVVFHTGNTAPGSFAPGSDQYVRQMIDWAAGFEPLTGACCDGITGVCEDDVLPDDCAGALEEWFEDELCVDLDPPCGGVCGDGTIDPGEECEPPGSDCCDALCDFEPVGTSCDDGEMCNGVEACDEDGVCVGQVIEDCNENEVEDFCDIEDGTSQDCNENDIPDECDIADGTSPDDNGNGVPDECEISAQLDIKPGSCPNPVNPRSRGVVPMAIVGGDTFDVTQIDVGTLKLRRADGVGGIAAPLSGPPGPGITTDDVATPFTGDLCDCHELDGDGIDDLLLKFSTAELARAFQLSELPSGASMMLTLSGSLVDGTAFEASDCVVIPGKPARSRQRGSRKRE